MSNYVSNYISNLYNLYKSANDKKQSLSEILESFSQISKNYKETSEIKNQENNYSSNNFLSCTDIEQQNIINNQLNNIKCLVTNSIYEKQGIIWNWTDIFKLITDETYKNTEKIKRKVVYSALAVDRPIGESAFDTWNGLQIIDLDIKNDVLANQLKPLIFENLSKYNWFLGICLSASKKSLHVWTKITPFATEHDHERIEYIVNFRHKSREK